MCQVRKTLDIISHFSAEYSTRKFVVPTLMKIVQLTESRHRAKNKGRKGCNAYWRYEFGNLGWVFELLHDLSQEDRQAVLLMIDRTKQTTLVPQCRKSREIVSFFSNIYMKWSWVRLDPLLEVMKVLQDKEFYSIGYFFDKVNALDEQERKQLLVLARELVERD